MIKSTSEKIQAARDRGYFRTVDLFAGCGGMTLGFHKAGFKCVTSVEIDDNARESHALNFKDKVTSGEYRSFSDVTKVEPSESVEHLSPNKDEYRNHVDVVIGGPPCQAFSRLGRAALWRLAEQDFAHAADNRATMYEHFLHYVAQLQPIAFVMENVREIGKFVGRNIAEEIAQTATDLGYETRYTLLNAVWFGVPQLRERAIIIGIKKELGVIPSFPKIKHEHVLPTGYSTSRAGTGHVEFLEPHDHYVDHLDYARSTKPAVTLGEAFADLPPIMTHLDAPSPSRRPQNPNSETKYKGEPPNEFCKIMRSWPGFTSDPKYFTGHIIRNTPRDFEIFKRMPAGAMYPEALEIAEQIFEERIRARETESGKKIAHGSKEWLEIRTKSVPPYKAGRYPNKFRKLWVDEPSRTLPAHIGKDTYSHIHFDSAQARGISLREAARIQSFPDGFKFSGSMNSQLRQIGNAVPPLLAYEIANHLKKLIK